MKPRRAGSPVSLTFQSGAEVRGGMARAAHSGTSDPLDHAVARAFAPIHKRAFGIAVGVATGLLLFLLTAWHVVLRPENGLNIALLREYFFGYTVSWPGAVIGGLWGLFTGYVAGWFVAFCRNFALGVMLFIGRTRGELEANRDFLDHI